MEQFHLHLTIIVPVRVPGIAKGRTLKNNGFCGPKLGPSRIEGGTALNDDLQATIIVGKVIKDKTIPPTNEVDLGNQKIQ